MLTPLSISPSNFYPYFLLTYANRNLLRSNVVPIAKFQSPDCSVASTLTPPSATQSCLYAVTRISKRLTETRNPLPPSPHSDWPTSLQPSYALHKFSPFQLVQHTYEPNSVTPKMRQQVPPKRRNKHPTRYRTHKTIRDFFRLLGYYAPSGDLEPIKVPPRVKLLGQHDPWRWNQR